MMPGIVNGRAWLAERRRFLKDELAKDPPEGQRQVLESELAKVNEEIGTTKHHWFRWILGSRPPV